MLRDSAGASRQRLSLVCFAFFAAFFAPTAFADVIAAPPTCMKFENIEDFPEIIVFSDMAAQDGIGPDKVVQQDKCLSGRGSFYWAKRTDVEQLELSRFVSALEMKPYVQLDKVHVPLRLFFPTVFAKGIKRSRTGLDLMRIERRNSSYGLCEKGGDPEARCVFP